MSRLCLALSLALLPFVAGCIGPLAPMKPYAPLLRPLAPDPVCTHSGGNTVDAQGQVDTRPAASNCQLVVPLPGGGRRR